jgi:hypothetical protein
MNRLIVFIAVAIALIGPASGASLRYMEQAPATPRVIAGEVTSDGSIVHGEHFRVHHISYGSYEIQLDKAYFLNVCPIVTVTPAEALSEDGPETYYVSQSLDCTRIRLVFNIPLSPNAHEDTAFNFIAAATK